MKISTYIPFSRIKNKIAKINKLIKIKIIKRIYTQKAKKEENILFWNSGGGGWQDLIYFDGIISNALQLRGHKTHAIIFDGTYKAYAGRYFKSIFSKGFNKEIIKDVKAAESLVKQLDFDYSKFGDYLSEFEKKKHILLQKILIMKKWRDLNIKD